jgi:hypothetical protein
MDQKSLSVTSLEIVLHDRPRRPVFSIRTRAIGQLTVQTIKNILAEHLKVFAVSAAATEIRTGSGHLLSESTTIDELQSIPPLFRPSGDGSAASSPRSQRQQCSLPADPGQAVPTPPSRSSSPFLGRALVLRAMERDISIAAAVVVDQQQTVLVDGLCGHSTVSDIQVRLQRVLNVVQRPKLFDASGTDELDEGVALSVLRCRYRRDDTISQVLAANRRTLPGVAGSAADSFLSTLHLVGVLNSRRPPCRSSESPVPRTPSHSVLAEGTKGVVAFGANGEPAAPPQLVQVFKTFDDWEQQPVSIQHSPDHAQNNAGDAPVAALRHHLRECSTEPRQVISRPPQAETATTSSSSLKPYSSDRAIDSGAGPAQKDDGLGIEAPTLVDFSSARRVNHRPAGSGSNASDGDYSSASGPGERLGRLPQHLWGRFIHTVQPRSDTPAASAQRFVDPATRLTPGMSLHPGGGSIHQSGGRDEPGRSLSQASSSSALRHQFMVGPTRKEEYPSKKRQSLAFDEIFIVGSPQQSTSRRITR